MKKKGLFLAIAMVLACGTIAACANPSDSSSGSDNSGTGGSSNPPITSDSGSEEEIEYGIVSGTVTAYGEPLSGVKVTIGDKDTVTSATGAWSISDVEVGETTVTFSKTGYANKTVTLAKTDFTGDLNAAVCDAQMNLSIEKATLGGTVTYNGSALAGVKVSIGKTEVTTDAEGKYSIADLDVTGAEDYTVTFTHPICVSKTEKVALGDLTDGAHTLDVVLEASTETVNVLDKTYAQLLETAVNPNTDFGFSNTDAGWNKLGNVQTHGEGICFHIDNDISESDMVSTIWTKMSITAENSKMMFRARRFVGQGALSGMTSVRVIELNGNEGYKVVDVEAKNGATWQEIATDRFVSYEYDLSAFEGKDVIVLVGAKQGQHNVIERIRFIAKNDNFVLPFVTTGDLTALTASEAKNLTSVSAINEEINNNWSKVGAQGSANEGWLFRDADYAEAGSTDLNVFAYKKYTFTEDIKTIVVRARTFTGQNNPNGHPDTYPELIVKLLKDDGTEVTVTGMPTVDNGESCENFYFSASDLTAGDYTLVIGMARGQRLAIEQISYLGAKVENVNASGVVKDTKGNVVEGATVSYGDQSVTTDAEGKYTIPVSGYVGESVSISVAKEGCQTVNKSVEITNGTALTVDDVALEAPVIEGLTMTTINGLSVLTDTKFEENGGAHSLLNNWGKYGEVHSHNEGACLELKAADGVSYVYGKFTISSANRYMKFNARMFVRDSDMAAGVQVRVIKADGTVEVVKPTHVYRSGENKWLSNLSGNALINDNDGYTEGAYDLNAYMGETIVIVVEAVHLTAYDTSKQIHNAINEIAFKDTPYFTSGAYVENATAKGIVKDAEGNALAGATVSFGDTSVTTDADGAYSIAISGFEGDSVSIAIAKENYKTETISIALTSETEYTVNDTALKAALMAGMSQADIDALNVLSEGAAVYAESGSTHTLMDNWTEYGSVSSHDEGACLELNSADAITYIYAKFKITSANRYMKYNARMFVRDSDQATAIKVSVIKADGTVEVLTPTHVYRSGSDVSSTNLSGNLLINDNDSYTEGAYDLGAYEGQTVVIVIQAVYHNEYQEGKAVHNAINEVAFKDTPYFS